MVLQVQLQIIIYLVNLPFQLLDCGQNLIFLHFHKDHVLLNVDLLILHLEC